MLLGVLYALFTLLFSGFLPASTLPQGLSWLPYLSILRYTFELVLSNELLGQVPSFPSSLTIPPSHLPLPAHPPPPSHLPLPS